MPLAKDLAGLIHRYGAAIAASAEAVLNPRHKPGDPLPDLSDLECCRTEQSGHPFQFFPSQYEKVAGALAGIKAKGRVWMICEMGCGKSPMSLAVAWLLLKHRPFRLLIMCPGHIVRKWRREIEWVFPGAICRVIRNFNDMLKFQREAKTSLQSMVAVIGKDTAKLGFDVDRPCAAKRKMKLRVRLHSEDEVLPTDTRVNLTDLEVTRIVDVACCPRCGETVCDEGEDHSEPVSHEIYIARNQPATCSKCGDRLLTNAVGFRKNPHIDRYIQRHMKDVFDGFIADEIHELAAAESIQGSTFRTLASACRFTIGLTGSLIGGKASDLHANLWGMSPELLNAHGFNIQNYKGSRISAIARNERSFVRQYGVMEHQIIRNCRSESDDFSGAIHRGACGRRKSYKTNERPKPGINPNLFNHYLLDRAVFMGLDELGPDLPTIERILLPCKMDDELKAAYTQLDDELKLAVRKRSRGKGPPPLACTRIQALDAYSDRPWGWDPIQTPFYDKDGKRKGWEEVAWPKDLGENFIGSKDRKLLEIIQSELSQGRHCAVYPQFTGVHDVREKLMKLLMDAGIKALLLPDTVKPEAREDWILKHTCDVLVAHPKRVMTGLDLIQFPSLIWYELGYSTHVLRQASARARRPSQTKACKVFFLYYAGTIQEQALALMGEKESASLALEGVFDANALRAMMNGGKCDDIMAALANSLDSTKLNAEAAWKAPIVPARFKPKSPNVIQGLLFDLPQFALAT